MRYERKYRITTSSFESVRQEVLANPCGFTESFPDRVVNSVYYDDINYTSYNDNLLGVSHRVKYRVRWYGERLSEITNPVLEKKIKKNMLGTKEYFPVSDFKISEGAPDVNKQIDQVTNQLFPHVIVRYQRSYFESMDRTIRATIDQKLRYHSLGNWKLAEEINRDDAVILEIKYEQGNEELANECMQMLPYRLTKNSKYVSAMNYFLK